MYKWLENLDLSNFSVGIENFVNRLVDPASLAIPDAVFVSYRKPEQLRLMSAISLQEMSKQMEESRQFIEKAPQDISGIALVVKSSDQDNPYEKELKDILRFLVEKGKNRAEIRMTCNALNSGLIMAHLVSKQNKEASLDIINGLKKISQEDVAHLVDDYWNILQSSDKSSGFKLLPQYLEELITQQMVDLETQRKKLRDESGNDLTPEEVICPLTRQVIDVNQSLATQKEAIQFIMLIVVLAQLAKVKSNELDEFISNQDSDYVNKCLELLQQYVKNPKQTGFTEKQHELFNQLGMGKVLEQWQAHKIHAHSAVGIEDKENSSQDATQKTLSLSENIKNGSPEDPQFSPGQTLRFFSSSAEKKVETTSTITYTP